MALAGFAQLRPACHVEPARAPWPRRLGARTAPNRPESHRKARPSRPERQKSTEPSARAAPRRDFPRFRVDFRIDFRGFSRLHRASDSTRVAIGRTSVFAGRRSTSEGSQTLRKTRNSTTIHRKSARRCFVNAPHEKNSMFSLPDVTRYRF